jgi:hypothetical protein
MMRKKERSSQTRSQECEEESKQNVPEFVSKSYKEAMGIK